MKVKDESTGEVLVGRDLADCYVEVRFGDGASSAPRVARLTTEEARRLAALILFQSARPERPGPSVWFRRPRSQSPIMPASITSSVPTT